VAGAADLPVVGVVLWSITVTPDDHRAKSLTTLSPQGGAALEDTPLDGGHRSLQLHHASGAGPCLCRYERALIAMLALSVVCGRDGVFWCGAGSRV
jgi:hypothetical protein